MTVIRSRPTPTIQQTMAILAAAAQNPPPPAPVQPLPPIAVTLPAGLTEAMKIQVLVAEAMARFEAQTPEEQKEHRRAQRKSWIVGEMLIENPGLTKDEAEKVAESVISHEENPIAVLPVQAPEPKP